MPITVAWSRENYQLNRYNNVAPNDQHRMILEPYKNQDYINASIARSSSDPVESGQFYILGMIRIEGYQLYRTKSTSNIAINIDII